MILGFIELKTIFTIAHLLGVVIGMGGAFASDTMFFSSLKDQILSKTELRFLKLGGRMVWLGLGLIFISGITLFLTDPAGYLNSTKFLAKMTIVLLIALNGLYIHKTHLPIMFRTENKKLADSPRFMKSRPFILASGAISVTSWIFALVLGALRSIPYSYGVIMLVYLVCIAIALSGTALLKEKIIKSK